MTKEQILDPILETQVKQIGAIVNNLETALSDFTENKSNNHVSEFDKTMTIANPSDIELITLSLKSLYMCSYELNSYIAQMPVYLTFNKNKTRYCYDIKSWRDKTEFFIDSQWVNRKLTEILENIAKSMLEYNVPEHLEFLRKFGFCTKGINMEILK